MTDFGERLRERREAQAVQGEAPPMRRGRSLLRSPAPAPDAGRDQIMAWTTDVLGLASNPIASVTRFGRHEDARLVITLRSGLRVVFDRQADVFDAPVLRRRVIIASGATIPHYGPPDAQIIATALLRMSDMAAEDDDRSEAWEWAETFLDLAGANVIDVVTFGRPAGRWEALFALRSWRRPPDLPPYAPVAAGAVIVREAGSGRRLVRTSDVAAHVRGLTGRPLSWGSLHSRMVEIGWESPGELQQRQPGGTGKLKARVYVIPSGWQEQ